MAGVYVSSGVPNYRPLGEGAELNNVLRAALISAQRLLRERFENRVAWVDGHWQWRREKAGAEAPPLPAAARQQVADVSRLFEILTNAQFRDRTHKAISPEVAPPAPHLFPGPPGAPGDAAPAARGADAALAACVLLLLAAAVLWAGAAAFLSQDSNRRRIKQLKQRIRGWFSKKAAAASGQADVAPAPPLDEPPPPYCAGAAEPFLPAGRARPPPYSRAAGARPPCTCAQLQRLLDGSCPGAAPEAGDGGPAAAPTTCGTGGGKTDETDECPPNSDGEEVCGDTSRVVVV